MTGRVLLAYCLLPAHALLAPGTTRTCLVWLPPSVVLPAVVPRSVLPPSVVPRSVLPPAPARRAHKIETQGTMFRSSLGMETPDSAEAQRGRGKGLGWSDDYNLAVCRAVVGVSQDIVRGAGMTQAQYARRIRPSLQGTLYDRPRPALRMGREIPSIGDAGTAGRACRAGSSGRKSRGVRKIPRIWRARPPHGTHLGTD
jgi:hypothetical protein